MVIQGLILGISNCIFGNNQFFSQALRKIDENFLTSLINKHLDF
jgi:hypothetical protein